jgi:hypothetical protein
MESLDVVYCSLERCALFRCQGISRGRKFLLGHGQTVYPDAVEAFRVGTQRCVASPADGVDYLECDGSDVGTRLLRGPG